jgi:polysaccharide export outer membrane protein
MTPTRAGRLSRALTGIRPFVLIAMLAGAVIVVPSCASKTVETNVVNVTPPKAEPYLIGKDDVLNVVVWKQPQLTGNVTVAGDGTITMPLAGTVAAAGLTTQELQEKLTQKLSKDIHNPNVTVSVVTANSMVFYVLGQVHAPGVYPLHPGEVLSQGLAQAGGLTDFANAKAIRVVRRMPGKDLEMTVNYQRIEDDGDVQDDVVLRAGDTITVP